MYPHTAVLRLTHQSSNSSQLTLDLNLRSWFIVSGMKMGYKVKELAELAGISERTLRYYDSIGLLKPERDRANGYRVYRQAQVDQLQQILFYREMGFALAQIKAILLAPDYSPEAALREHLTALRKKETDIRALIRNVEKSIRALEGETSMTDQEKFEGFKARILRENEAKYGVEVRARFGEKAAEESNRKVAGMSQEQWARQEQLAMKVLQLLREGMATGDPAGDIAQAAANAHRRWLSLFWGEGTYTRASHLALAEGYLTDARFTAYYDEQAGAGATQFLRDAVALYAQGAKEP